MIFFSIRSSWIKTSISFFDELFSTTNFTHVIYLHATLHRFDALRLDTLRLDALRLDALRPEWTQRL